MASSDAEEAASVVRACPLFSHLPRDRLSQASKELTLRHFPPGSSLAKEGSVSAGLFVLVRGSASVAAQPPPPWPQGTPSRPQHSAPSGTSELSPPTHHPSPVSQLAKEYGSPLKPGTGNISGEAGTSSPLGISLDDDLGSAAAEAEAARELEGGEASSHLPQCKPYSLRPGDWFGHPPSSSPPPPCSADVTATSEVLCAVFPNVCDSMHLGIGSGRHGSSSLSGAGLGVQDLRVCLPIRLVPSPESLDRLLEGKLEEILDLQTLTDQPDAFQGVSPPEMFEYPRIFGGQLVGQALMAATRTVDPSLLVHSLHCYFIRPGHNGHPVAYRVERIRDGTAFSARRVKAYQGSREIFLFTASFHRPEPGHTFRARPPPSIPQPETLPMVEEEEWRLRTTPALPMVMRRRLARHPVRPMPADLRHCESVEEMAVSQILREYPHPALQQPHIRQREEAQAGGSAPQSQLEGGEEPGRAMQTLNVWMKARGLSPASSDLRLHRCVIAYLSDFVLLGTALAPHGLFPVNPRRLNMASLDHAMWFHEECRADEWLLYSLASPWSGHGRGMSLGRFFTREGVLAVSTAQEGLIRPIPQQESPAAKL